MLGESRSKGVEHVENRGIESVFGVGDDSLRHPVRVESRCPLDELHERLPLVSQRPTRVDLGEAVEDVECVADAMSLRGEARSRDLDVTVSGFECGAREAVGELLVRLGWQGRLR